MINLPGDRITYLARTDFRNSQRLFGIRQADRRHHIYIIGKTGTGKSTLLETMMRQDILAGHGFALIDPHGDLLASVREFARQSSKAEVIDFDLGTNAPALGYNPLLGVEPSKRALAASFLVEAFRKLWPDSWGPRLEHVLRYALLALLDIPGATIGDVLRLLDDRIFRRHVAEQVFQPRVRDFWLREFEGYPARLRAEVIAPIQNKVGAFLAHPIVDRLLSASRASFSLRQVIDSGAILLVNLPKGQLGGDAASLVGALILSGLELAAMSRADVLEDERLDFAIYVDEFHSFASTSLVTMLAELRKYRVHFVLAHQYLGQLGVELREAIFGNIGTLIAFRAGLSDAKILEQEFGPEFRGTDLSNLPNYRVLIRLMVRGKVTRPFSAGTIPQVSDWLRAFLIHL